MKNKNKLFSFKNKTSDKNSIGKNAVILTFSKMLVLMVSMIISMLLSRYLTLNEYGTYSTILLITNIAITIFVLGLPNSINFFLSAATEEEKQEFTSIYYTLSSILCIIAGFLLVFSVPFIEQYFNNDNIKLFWYALAILPWTKVVLSSIDNFLIVFNKTKMLIKFKIINSAMLLLSVVLIKVFKLSFSEYIFIYVLLELIFSFVAIKLSTLNIKKTKVKYSRKVVKKILYFSVPLGIASVVGTLTIELGKLIIGGFFDTEMLAIYTNASKEMPVTIIAASLTAVLMPQLVKLIKENKVIEAVNLWKITTTLSYMFMCFFTFYLFFNSREIITFLYSAKYLPGENIFKIYTLIILVRTTYFGMILNSTGKTKFVLYSSVFSLVINVILSYLLYYTLGFIGPAIATLISMFATAAFQLIASSKSVNVNFKSIMEWKEIMKITFINIILGLIMYNFKMVLYKGLQLNNLLIFLFISFIWGIIYVIIYRHSFFEKWNAINKETL